MKDQKRQFLSEYAVCLYSARWLMTTASQLMSGGVTTPEKQDIIDNSHIYLICKLPSLSFSQKSFNYKNGKISGHLIYKSKGKLKEIPFDYDCPLIEDEAVVKLSDYPHREVLICDINGKEIRYLPALFLCARLGLHVSHRELGNLEVLYVGQAFADGTRNAFDRLKSHSTLQKILAQTQYESPDSEIYVLGFEYCHYSIFTLFDGKAKDVISDYRDLKRFRSIIDNPLTEHQQICLVEAGLIRYFQPHYNEIYKNNFPNPNHKILQSCYDLDFSGLVIEIDTEELMFSLYSKTAFPSGHHICKIDILDPAERWGFFYFTLEDGNVCKMPNVINSSKT